jgi:hypothetical protein
MLELKLNTGQFRPAKMEVRGEYAYSMVYRYSANISGRRVAESRIAVASGRDNSWDLYDSIWVNGFFGYPKTHEGDVKYVEEFVDGTMITVNVQEQYETMFLSMGTHLISKIGRSLTNKTTTYLLFTNDVNLFTDEKVKNRTRQMVREYMSKDGDDGLDDQQKMEDVMDEELDNLLREDMLMTEKDQENVEEDVLDIENKMDEIQDDMDNFLDELDDESEDDYDSSSDEDWRESVSVRSLSLLSQDSSMMRRVNNDYLNNSNSSGKAALFNHRESRLQYTMPKKIRNFKYRYMWRLNLPFNMRNTDRLITGINKNKHSSGTIYGVLPSGNEGTRSYDSSGFDEILNLIENLDPNRRLHSKNILSSIILNTSRLKEFLEL